jgi:DNA-binding IclR family transcriptional regulator
MIQSVERAANILKTLAAGPGLLGVSELSARLGLAKGTIHGLLRTLEAHGLVEQDPASDKYRLGAALLRLGNSYLDSSDLRARSLVWSERLAARTGQAVRVGVPHGQGVLVIHHVFRPDNTLQILEVGAVLPAHASALGKAIVAFDARLERELLAQSLPRLTGRTHTSHAALRRDLCAIRGRGYAVEREEAVIGDGSIAAPIFDRTAAPVGAVGVAGPVGPLARKGAEAGLAAGTIEAARAISRELGASGWPPAPVSAAPG